MTKVKKNFFEYDKHYEEGIAYYENLLIKIKKQFAYYKFKSNESGKKEYMGRMLEYQDENFKISILNEFYLSGLCIYMKCKRTRNTITPLGGKLGVDISRTPFTILRVIFDSLNSVDFLIKNPTEFENRVKQNVFHDSGNFEFNNREFQINAVFKFKFEEIKDLLNNSYLNCSKTINKKMLTRSVYFDIQLLINLEKMAIKDPRIKDLLLEFYKKNNYKVKNTFLSNNL